MCVPKYTILFHFWLIRDFFSYETDYNISSEQYTQKHDKNQCDKEEGEEGCS